MGMLRSLRWALGRVWDGRGWRPEHATLLWQQIAHRNRNVEAGFTDRDHLKAAAAWLAAAQDAMPDGGVSGRYLLGTGWSSSYPETTGYLIPTFLALADELGDDRFRARAARAVDFLLRLQFEDGSFPAGEVGENRSRPSVFNTAQILHGLVAWHAATSQPRVLAAARRAGDWLVAMQDPDGAWRRHVYGDVATTYSAHASCWLAELGQYTGEQVYLRSAERHLDWVLSHRDPGTGWIDRAGFSREDHEARRASTHTIAYTLWGILFTSEVLGREDGLNAVRHAAAAVARRLEISGSLPGVLDHRWRAAATYGCLTGVAQMALIWLRLFELDRDARFVSTALKALDLVKLAQPMFTRDVGIYGGVPGSAPLWGDYLYMALPNWAVKFFVDGLLVKQRVLAQLAARPRPGWTIPPDIPRELPRQLPRQPSPMPRVVLYATRESTKVAQMVLAWAPWEFKPTAVVLEQRRAAPPLTVLAAAIRAHGARGVLARLVRRRSPRSPRVAAAPALPDAASFCRSQGIPMVVVGALDTPHAVEAVRALAPDVAIHAGAGILRPALLAVPRLGTLNAHMGILPRYRGMNVAEWARFEGSPVGCSVHLIDAGIDTGDIACVQRVDVRDVRTIAELRRRVDTAQIALLGEVVRRVAATGCLPARRRQEPGEGTQYFRMHPELAAVLEAELRSPAPVLASVTD
jgi:folate-dependent phosphoribosylglycinamide formyltransferase PurN